MSMDVNVCLTHITAQVPTYASEGAAGADLHACINKRIPIWPNDTMSIPTGVSIEIPEGYMGLVFARSGLASMQGLSPANKVGVIDSDYRGEIFVVLYNHSKEIRFIEPGQRIAQLVISPVVHANFMVVNNLAVSGRGSGGFGSTGK